MMHVEPVPEGAKIELLEGGQYSFDANVPNTPKGVAVSHSQAVCGVLLFRIADLLTKEQGGAVLDTSGFVLSLEEKAEINRIIICNTDKEAAEILTILKKTIQGHVLYPAVMQMCKQYRVDSCTLINELSICARMLMFGERIAFGQDSELMFKAADKLTQIKNQLALIKSKKRSIGKGRVEIQEADFNNLIKLVNDSE